MRCTGIGFIHIRHNKKKTADTLNNKSIHLHSVTAAYLVFPGYKYIKIKELFCG